MFNFANAYAKGLRSDTFQVQTTAPYCILNDPYCMGQLHCLSVKNEL